MRAFIRGRRPQEGKTSAFGIPCLVVVALLLSVVPWQPVGAAADGTQAFEQAVKAFRAGDYPAALQLFLDARKAGLDTRGLHYNLGAAYYRLQRYPESEREFEGLASDPEWAALAHYNLGLIAQRTGRELQAIAYFERAHLTTTDPNLRTLAATASSGSAPRTRAPRLSRRWPRPVIVWRVTPRAGGMPTGAWSCGSTEI